MADSEGVGPTAAPGSGRAAWVAIAVGVIPIVVSAGRAVAQGRLPLGDDAYFTVRSRDVLGPHHPSLGAWSSGSTSLSESVNNLGPLQLDLLAPFTKVEWTTGTAVGAAALNLAAAVGVGLVARRLLDPRGVVLAMGAVALVAWAMGSELLIGTRQHHALILPFLCFLVLCWGLAAGDRWLLPWTALVGSLLVQTHLSYLVVAPALAAWGIGALVARTVATGREGDGPWWAELRAPAAATVAVLAVAWAQTVADQIAGTGNMGRLLTAGSEGDGSAPGWGRATDIVSAVVAHPAAWTQRGFGDFAPGIGPSGPIPGAVRVAVVLGLLAGALALTRRTGDRPAATAVATAAVAVVAAVVSAAVTPAGSFGPVDGNYRWLWPVAAFGVLALLLAVAGRASGASDGRRGRVVLVLGVVVLVGLTAANVAAADQLEFIRTDRRLRPVAEDLARQVEDAGLDGPVLYDRTQAGLFEPYTYVVLATLQDDGVAFTFDDDSLDVRRFGSERADRGRARQRLVLVTGPGARRLPPAAERVALASTLDTAEVRRQRTLVTVVSAAVARGSLRRTAGSDDAPATPALDALAPGSDAPSPEVAAEVALLADADALEGPADEVAAAEELADLYEEDRLGTVGLYLEPTR